MKMIVKLIKIDKNEIITLGIALGIAYILGIVIGCILMNGNVGMPCYIPFGAVTAVIIVMLFQAAMTLTTFGRAFNLAVSMGVTRKKFLLGYQLFTLAELLILFLCFGILYRIESAAAGIFFPAESVTDVLNFLLKIKFLLPAVLIVWCLEFFIEAVTMKFGAKAWWTIWAVWMAICLGFPNMLVRGLKGKLPAGLMKLGSLFAAGGKTLWIACGAVIFAVLLLISWNILRKQQVTA